MEERLARTVARFGVIDAEIDAFQAATGLACPPGCGACCNSPEVEATAVELEPTAEALIDAGRAEAVLQDLAAAPRPGRCVLFAADPADSRRGRCSAYTTRPLICRLFAFGSRHDRAGRLELVSCRVMREADPARMAAAEGDRAALKLAPVMAEHAHAVGAEAPGHEALAQPINASLEFALRKALLRRAYRAGE